MKALPASHIIRAVVDAASRWRNADFPPRVRATKAVMRRSGYTEPVVDYALDRLFEQIDRSTLQHVITSELASLEALDGFVTRPGRPDVFFRGLSKAVIIASDTTIGVALPALIFALCAKAQVTVKNRDDRLVAAFVETLVEEEPALAESVCVEVWEGSDSAQSRARVSDADVVVAYGSNTALAAIRAQLAPHVRFVGFGHRTSVGYITREALRDETAATSAARAAALDALLYDGDGCLSLHALFVERVAAFEPLDFAYLVARACDEVAIEFPAGYTEVPPAVAAYRNAARFRAAQGHGIVYEGSASPHLIVYDAPLEEPPPLLPRTLALYPVHTPDDALAYIRRHRLPLEAFARSNVGRSHVEAVALASGASWIAPLGWLQAPPLGGEHGGEGRILPFVRAIYRE